MSQTDTVLQTTDTSNPWSTFRRCRFRASYL